MKKSNKFSPEVRERAVRLVQEHRGEYPSLWAAIESIAPKIGCVPQTLNEWVKRVEVDTGVREGVTTSEAQRMKELEREVKELRRARRARFSPRRSSTAGSSPEGLHRQASRCLRGRAALQGLAGRPVGISTTCGAAARALQALRPGSSRRDADATD